MAENNRIAGNRPCRGIMHIVGRGDTLYKISRRYNVKVSAIMLANPYMNIYNLQVGDEICIPRVGPVRPVPPIQVVRPPVRPPVKPPVKPVPPIGSVKPPVTPVPPIGELTPPVTPVPPVGDLRPPTTIMPRTVVEAEENDSPETSYDTIDYEYEAFRKSLQDLTGEEVQADEEAETAAEEPEEIREEVRQADVEADNGIETMLETLNGSFTEFNKYMKSYLEKR